MKTLPCLSVRQPWAWLIVNGHKPVENRSWSTGFRGRLLIHAGKTLDESYLEEVQASLRMEFGEAAPVLPPIDQLERGGVVGEVVMTDCVREHASRYFTGPYGFVMAGAKSLPFVPWRGMQGFFNVPAHAIESEATT
jgi:hypothetical protein